MGRVAVEDIVDELLEEVDTTELMKKAKAILNNYMAPGISKYEGFDIDPDGKYLYLTNAKLSKKNLNGGDLDPKDAIKLFIEFVNSEKHYDLHLTGIYNKTIKQTKPDLIMDLRFEIDPKSKEKEL